MATIAEIKAELTGVNAATYSGMTDAEAAAALVAINNVEQRESISGSELFGYPYPRKRRHYLSDFR